QSLNYRKYLNKTLQRVPFCAYPGFPPYLDNPENSAEDRLEDLEEKYDSLEKLVTKLHKQLQSEAKKNNSLEIRVEELSRAMTTFLEQLK
ncbi:MAG: hypothetical protein AAFS12_07405, partial [Cyanobacteria bacterium J06632_19]